MLPLEEDVATPGHRLRGGKILTMIFERHTLGEEFRRAFDSENILVAPRTSDVTLAAPSAMMTVSDELQQPIINLAVEISPRDSSDRDAGCLDGEEVTPTGHVGREETRV